MVIAHCGERLLLLFAVIALIATWSTGAGAGRQDYLKGKQHWQAKEYQSAYDSLMVFRREPYGRRAEVDYMLATSACRLQGHQAWGAEVLEWLPYGYPLDSAAQTIVAAERRLCAAALAGGALSAVPGQTPQALVSAGMTAIGKTFYWAGRDIPVNSYPARKERDIKLSELDRRMAATRSPEATSEVLRLLASNDLGDARAVRSKHFILASLAGHDPSRLREIAADLEAYLAFLIAKYGMPIPDYAITVYLLPSVADLRKLAQNLHGLDVSPATIGYSFVEDRSVVGVIPSDRIGTLYHELFHLVVRANFGDIPQWLDEGMAALYEVSSHRCGQVYGEPNWRGRVLQELESFRPSVAQLISASWFPPDMPGRYEASTADHKEIRRQAAIMATARYLALYLQETGQLVGLYTAFRDRENTGSAESIPAQSARLVDVALGQSVAELDARFWSWFEELDSDGRIVRPGNHCEGDHDLGKHLPTVSP